MSGMFKEIIFIIVLIAAFEAGCIIVRYTNGMKTVAYPLSIVIMFIFCYIVIYMRPECLYWEFIKTIVLNCSCGAITGAVYSQYHIYSNKKSKK